MKRKIMQCISTALAAALTVSSLMMPGNTIVSDAATPERATVHDPSIAVSKEGTYYVFGSHLDAAKSTDLINWKNFTEGLMRKPNSTLYGNLSTNLHPAFLWAGENDVDSKNNFSVWAPDVFWNENYVNADGTKGAYMIYFCTSSTAIRSVIAFGTSQNIEGPYTFGKTLVYSGFTKASAKDPGSSIDKIYTNTNIDELMEAGVLQDGLNDSWFSGNNYNNSYAPNAIDPTVFQDKEGKLWMTYGSWSGGIFILEIDPATGEAKYPGKNSTTADGLTVDQYFGTRIAGGFAHSGEGPYILYDKASDYYYLYVTYEFLDSKSGYNMRLFRSKNPAGPYTDAAGNNAVLPSRATNHSKIGIKVMGNYSMPSKGIDFSYMSPGHNSAFIDEKSGQRYLIYHTRFKAGSENHQIRIHQQFMNSQGWPVTAVYENKGDSISESGYSKDSVIGDYYFINHGTASDRATCRQPSTITLNTNGTVTGDASGTWSLQDGTYYMSLTTNGVTYDGVFFRQKDESSASVQTMTFTAIGTNNETIWGVQKSLSLSASKSTIYTGGNKDNTSQLKVNGLAGRTATISYKSSKKSVASVNSKGKVTAKKKGSATITVTVKYGDVTKTMSKKITVKKASLKLKSKKKKLKRGKSFKYKVTAKGIKASSVRFSSSNPKVLSINKKSGKAKAKAAGTATITAKYKKIKVKIKVKVS